MLPSLAGLPALWGAVARGRHFHLRTVAREPRAEATARLEAAVQGRRGDILDFKMFSNLSLNLLVELAAEAVVGLADDLARLGWDVELDPPRADLASRGAERLEGTLLVDFPEGDGELIIPLPRVPG